MTTVTKQIHFAIKSRRKTAVPGPPPEPTESTGPVGRTPRVAKLMALAIRFDQLLQEGKVADQSELARLAHVTQPRMTQIMNLLHLAPDIQEEILCHPTVVEGHDPITERDLRPIAQLRAWQHQRREWKQVKEQRTEREAKSSSYRDGSKSTPYPQRSPSSFHSFQTSAPSGSSFNSALASRQDG